MSASEGRGQTPFEYLSNCGQTFLVHAELVAHAAGCVECGTALDPCAHDEPAGRSQTVTEEQVAVAWWWLTAPDDTTAAEARARFAAVGVHDQEHLRAVAAALVPASDDARPMLRAPKNVRRASDSTVALEDLPTCECDEDPCICGSSDAARCDRCGTTDGTGWSPYTGTGFDNLCDPCRTSDDARPTT